MKSHELLEVIGAAQDSYLLDAKAPKKIFTPVWVKWAAMAACLCLIVGLAIPIFNQSTEIPDNPNPGALPAHFYLNGNGYFYHGKLVYELPPEYEYIGDVINVGDTFSNSRKDFEGNVDGHIYMSGSDVTIAYFQWKDWDDEVDGKEPYLILEIERTDKGA